MKLNFLGKIGIFIFIFLFHSLISTGQNQYISFNKKTDKAEQKTLPDLIKKDNGTSSFEMEYNFPGAQASKVIAKKTNYNFLHIKGFGKMNIVGKPALPAHNDIIAIPDGSNPKIVILETEYKEISGYYIHPALEPARDTYGAKPPEFEIDEKTYNTDAYFPSKNIEIIKTNLIRGNSVAVVQIRPAQFNPVTHKLRVFSKIKYRIEFEGGTKSYNNLLKNNSSHFIKLFKKTILNNKYIRENKKGSTKNSESKNYIIVTHSEYKAAADTLAKWKKQLGYSVEIISRSSWTSEEVKNAIHDSYENWSPKPDYFVIIGDHTGSYAVPGEIHKDPGNTDDFATDLYYACMDGAYDYYPDMAHGRISVSSASEAMDVIHKIVNYERNPVNDANFYTNGLNCAMFQDVADEEIPDGYAARRFCHTSEDIRDYMQGEQGYSVERIYYTDDTNTPTNFNNGYFSNGEAISDELLKSNGYKWDGDQNDILSSINAGKFYVFHRDHGYSGGSGWHRPYFTTSEIPSLTNGNKLPVVFSINCHTGEFQLDNCFAEKFLRQPNGGAVGVVAASYYSYSGNNDGFSAGMIDAIWSNPGLIPSFGNGGVSNPVASSANNTYTMGDVVNQGLIRMIEIWGDNRYTNELFHWFGDPAMKIWTANPNENTITASVPASVDCDATSLSISDCNITDAVATLCFNDELLATVQLSEGSGTLNFSVLGNSTEKPIVTISKHNCKPLITELNITGTCNYPPQAEFTAKNTNVNLNNTTNFNDESTFNPTSWLWTFEGGTPETSSDENPTSILYVTEGTYDVTLVATNEYGSDALKKNNFITVIKHPPIYCDACSNSSSTTSEYINKVQFNEIDYSSETHGYEDKTNLSTEAYIDSTYQISITTNNSYSSDQIFVWIDWNIDGDFEDDQENVFVSSTGKGPFVSNITIPNFATNENTRMRIRLHDSSDGGNTTSCGNSDYGEVEDYTIVVKCNIDDANLSNLTIDGNSIFRFNSTTLTYDHELPYGTSTVPTVDAITKNVNATYVISEATSLPGTTNVIVTAEDDLTEKTYSISFVVALPSNDATLSDLKTDDITVSKFAPEVYTYNIELPYGTSTVPTTTASTNYASASSVVNDATSLPGTTTIIVTAEDGITEKTYSISFVVALPSNDATLSDLKTDDITVSEFAPEVYTYNIELPYGTSTVPTTTASTNYASASSVVNDATSLPGTTTVIVTAEDGITEKTYSISFVVALPSNDATLSDLKTDDITVPEFAPEVYTYNIELPYGTSTVPTTTASTNYASANYVVNEATSLPGTTNVIVTAEDGITEKTYSVSFAIEKPSNDATLSDLKTNDITVPEFAPEVYTYNVELLSGTSTVPKTTASTNYTNASYVVNEATSLPGTTNVVVTAEDDLTEKTYSINFTFKTGIYSENHAKNSDISIYPNPATSIINLKINTDLFFSIMIFDTKGTCLYHKTDINAYKGFVKKINIKNFNKGIYYFKIITTDNTIVKKLVIE